MVFDPFSTPFFDPFFGVFGEILVISGRVGSARSQLFMPGLHHAHTLQHTKKKFMDAPPRESVLINLRQDKDTKHKQTRNEQ